MGIELREALAALEHVQWAMWTQWQLTHTDEVHIRQWQRQIATPYHELSEEEKNSDREWADKVLTLLLQHGEDVPQPQTYTCNGCGKTHPKGEPCPDAHLLDTAAQRLGWLLFQAGKTASGTAIEQYCELGMVAARELLRDPAGWAQALGLPEPPVLTGTAPGACPSCGKFQGHIPGCFQYQQRINPAEVLP